MYIIPRSSKKCVGDGVNTSVNCQMAKIISTTRWQSNAMTIRGLIMERWSILSAVVLGRARFDDRHHVGLTFGVCMCQPDLM
jgi:hypothetical protein